MELRDLKAGDCIMKVGAEREYIRTYNGMFSHCSLVFFRGEVLTVINPPVFNDEGRGFLVVYRGGRIDEIIVSTNADISAHFDYYFRKL